MADVPSSLRKVQIEEVSYRSALSESLFFKLGGVINWIIDNAGFKLGDIQATMFDEATFQAARTTDWILMDGRSVIGSDYDLEGHGTNVPDARGRTLRFKDNGAGFTTDLALGTLQGSQNLAHRHEGTCRDYEAYMRDPAGGPDLANLYIVNGFGAWAGKSVTPQTWKSVGNTAESYHGGGLTGGGGGFGGRFTYVDSGRTDGGAGPAETEDFYDTKLRLPSDGGSEVRVPNIHINYFIKINN